MAITATERTQIVELTVLMFNAAPGATYLSQLVALYEADGHNLQTLAVQLGNSAAYQTLNPNFQLAADFATAFLTPLGLQADAVAVAFVTSKFNAGESKGQIAFEAFTALNAVTSANGPQYQNAKAILLNKTAVAEYYSEVKAVAETNLGALQNVLSTITADPATVTAEIAALNVVPPQTFNLTTGVDVVHAEVGANSIVTGTADTAGTFTVGDIVTGNATTVFNLSLNGTPTSLATVTNVGTVNLNADASTTVNADLWSGIGAINVVTPTIAGTTTTISNAQVVTTIGDYSGNQASITVTYRDTSGSADTAHIALGGTGTSTAPSTIDVSSGNTVEGLAIVTSGTDIATINGGTKVKTITLTGTGTDTFTFGATAATLTVDASGETAAQKLTFAAGSIGAEDTITGGTGADTVTANSSTTFAHMTGVETFVTTVDGGVALYDGANVSGLTTMTVNQGASAGSEWFSNMKGEFTTLTINGPTGSQEVDYNSGANATLTINYGPGSTQFDTTFDGLTVKNVASLTVNMAAGGTSADAMGTGNISLDKVDTTSLTIAQNGTDDTITFDVTRADALDNLSVSATAEGSGVFVYELPATDVLVQGLQTLTITASGNSSYAGVDGNIDYGTTGSGSSYTVTTTTNAMSLTTGAITASGDNSTAYLYTQMVNVGDMTSFTITASGVSSDAYVYDEFVNVGKVGSLTITASGDNSVASIDSYVTIIGDVGSISLVASGNSGYANITDTVYVKGDLGSLNLTASGSHAYAYLDSGFTVYGNLGSFTLVASGTSSYAFSYGGYVYGDLGAFSMTASGANARADVELQSVTGDLGSFTITASGNGSSAYLYTDLTVSGDVGSLTMLASGANSDADFDGYYMDVYGNMGPVSITASGTTAHASAYAYVSGNISSIAVTASGANSSADAYFYNNDTAMNVVSATITASGVGSQAYAQIYTGTSGVLATTTISATKANADATLDFKGNSFGTIAASTGSSTATVNLTLDNQTAPGGTITGTGSGTLNVTLSEHGIATLSAGAMTGPVNVTVSDITKATTAMTLTTGAGADNVQGGAGVDTFNLGAGKDTFNFTNVSADADVLAATAPTDIIAGGFTSDLGSATLQDHIAIGYGAGSGTNYVEALTPAASFTAFVTAANTALNGTVFYYFGVVGTDGYLAYDQDGVGTTGIIKLTGVTDMDATDITA